MRHNKMQPIHQGTDNVFADLNLANAQELHIKTGLVIQIRKAIRDRDLTQQQAAQIMGLTQPKVSAMMRGNFENLSERKLMHALTRLGYNIEIKVRRSRQPIGALSLSATSN